MNRALPEMFQCSDMTALERQRARLKWQEEQLVQQPQQEQQHQTSYFSELSGVFSSHVVQAAGFQGGLVCGDSVMYGGDMLTGATRQVKSDPGVEETVWSEMGLGFEPCGGYGNDPAFDVNYAISRTSSCPPGVAAAFASEAVEVMAKESVAYEKMGPAAVARESLKKRKVDKLQNSKVAAEDDSKRMKGCVAEGESKITGPNTNKSNSSSSNNNNNNKKENSGETSKENSKVSDVQKPDYIHVRARRGQATDSHSLAERVRREKISERMKYLQDLVPGCNKITGKAGMLDEIINYVQSLQRQVEFLSMKLAAVNPMLDFNIDNLFPKEPSYPSCTTNSFPAVGMSSEMANTPNYLQMNQVVPSCGLEMGMGMNSTDMALRRTISAPVSIPNGPFLAMGQQQQHLQMQQIQQPSATWDVELQNLYNVGFDQMGRSASFPSQPFTGSIEAGEMKMEM